MLLLHPRWWLKDYDMNVSHHSPVPGHTHPFLRHSAWVKTGEEQYLCGQTTYITLTMENASVQKEDTAKISNQSAVGTKRKHHTLLICR